MSALPWSTNESKALWRKRIQTRSVLFGDAVNGQVYVCPRCGWESKPKKWSYGAMCLGMEHDVRCGARVKVVA